MSDYHQKTWYATDDSLAQLAEISNAIGEANTSAGLRYCIKKTWNQMKQSGEIQ